jgi:hypothetical protein
MAREMSRWWFWPVVIFALLVIASAVTLMAAHNIPTYR